MTSTNLNRPLRGIIPPMVTPLQGRDELDHAGLEKLVEHILTGGVHGLFLLGTTGEGPALSYRLRRELIARTCKQVKGRVPVLVGVSDTAYEESRSLAAFAADAGADALVTAPPYYFPVSQSDLLRHVRQLSEDVPLPLYLYNIPSLTKTWFTPETVMAAAELPNVYGLKDSSGDLSYLVQLLDTMRHTPEFTLLVGPEELLMWSLQLGAHGGVCGGANLFPRLFVTLYDAMLQNDTVKAAVLHERVLQMGEDLYRLGEQESSLLLGLKLGLSLFGICRPDLAMPYRGAKAEEFRISLEQLKAYELV